MQNAISFLVVGAECMDDLMLWSQIARSLKARPDALEPVVIVHAPGEYVERLLEGKGLDVERTEGILRVLQSDETGQFARGAREEGRSIAASLTDEGVACVSFVVSDRGLLPDGVRTGWLRDLALTGTVPLLSAVMEDSDQETRSLDPFSAALALSHPGDTLVVLAGGASAERFRAIERGLDDDQSKRAAAASLIKSFGDRGASLEGVSVRISDVSALSSGVEIAGLKARRVDG